MSLKRQLIVIHVFFAMLGIAVLIAIGARLMGRRVVAPHDKSGILIPDADVVQALTDPATRVATARECGRKKDRSAVPILRGFAKDRNPEVRLACVWALGETGDPEAIYALRVRMGDIDVNVRKAAAEALGKMGGSGAGNAIYSLVDGLNDQSLEVQIASVEGLGMLKEQAASEALQGALAAGVDVEVRRAAVRVLSRRDDHDATKLLCRAISDLDAGVRLTAMTALNKRRTEQTYRSIAQALRDSDASVRAVALEAIAGIGKPILPHVKTVLPQTPHMEARFATVGLLAEIETDEAVEAMLEMLEGLGRRSGQSGPKLRDAIVKALAPRGKSALAALTKCVINGESSRLAEQAAGELCRRIGKPAVKPVSDGILRWKLYHDPEELKLWVNVLGDIGDPGAVEALNRALSQDIDGMDVLVAEARAKIEEKSKCRLPPAKPHKVAFHQEVPEMKSLNLPTSVRPPTTKRVTHIPDDGVVHLCLRGALLWPPNRTPRDLDVEMIRRDGKWVDSVWGRSIFYNRQHYPGRILGSSGNGDETTIRFGVALSDDGYVRGGYGEYTVHLGRDQGKGLTGRFDGHYDLRERKGHAHVECREGKVALPTQLTVEPGSHPRLFFRKRDLPVLRARARTELGRKIVKALIQKVVSGKAYDWRGRWNAVAYAGEVDRALAQGLLAHLFDDPLHGRRAARNVMIHNEHDPYAGEHGGPELPCLARMGFGYDLAYDYITEDERVGMLPRLLQFMHVITARHGMLGSYGDGQTGFACPLALALTREKGKLDVFPPKPVRAVAEVPGEKELVQRKGIPVNSLAKGRMLKGWLIAGPFDYSGDDPKPLANLGGPAKARPRENVPASYGGLTFRFVPLPKDAYLEAPGFGGKDACLKIPAAAPHSVSFLYSVLEVGKRQGVLLDCVHPVNQQTPKVWVNGREVVHGAAMPLEPGYYHIMLEVRGMVTSPYLFEVDAGYWHGRKKVYEFTMQEYKDAAARHEETGKLQSVRAILGYVRRGFRNRMRYEVDNARKGGYPLLGGLEFGVAAYQNAVGEPIVRDVPMPVDAFPALAWSRLNPARIPEIIHLAMPEIQAALLWEFNRAYLPDGLGKLRTPALIHTLVNYPMGVKARHPDEVLPQHTSEPDNGSYAFYGPKGRFSLRVNTRNRQASRTVTHLPKAGSFRLRGMGADWILDAGLARSRVWHPREEAPKRGVPWILEQDGDSSKRFEAVVRVDGSRMTGCGKVKYFETNKTGGRIGIDLTGAYSRGAETPIQAERHIAIDYSGKCGAPALVVVVDRINGGGQKTYVLPGRPKYAHMRGRRYWIYRTEGKGTEFLGESGSGESDGRRLVYLRDGGRRGPSASLQAHFIAPDKFDTAAFHISYGRGMAKSPIVMPVTKEKDADFFVVMTVQPDHSAAPKIVTRGSGLDAVVTVGERQISFDGKEIVISASPNTR